MTEESFPSGLYIQEGKLVEEGKPKKKSYKKYAYTTVFVLIGLYGLYIIANLDKIYKSNIPIRPTVAEAAVKEEAPPKLNTQLFDEFQNYVDRQKVLDRTEKVYLEYPKTLKSKSKSKERPPKYYYYRRDPEPKETQRLNSAQIYRSRFAEAPIKTSPRR